MATIGILGAGLSGVLMGIQLLRRGIEDLVVYERLPDVGGTWLRNTYPGLACDIPSHLYCYSFEPNPDFTRVYSGQAEIQAYIRRCAGKHGLLPRIRFDTGVESARFDEETGRWSVSLEDGSEAEHRVLVAATGGLTEPHFPRIPGRETFVPPLWHSGAWRHDVPLEGKTVAVVGSAASAVQVVPEVAKLAARVVVFSRTPNWVTPRNDAVYSEAERDAFRQAPAWRGLRLRQYRRTLLWHRAFLRHDAAIRELRDEVMRSMRAAIDDPALVEALTPSYPPGCKRILVSDDYYPALAKPHVTLVPHGVEEMTETTLVAADGSRHEVDAAIFCTGYKLGGRTDGRPAVVARGRGGRLLHEALRARPEAYRGVAVPGFPNYFTVCGINGSAAHAPVFLSAESGTDYIARWIERLLHEDLRSVEVRADAARRYSEAVQGELQQMSWAGDCPGWYRDRQGRILPFHPGTWGRMRRELRSLHEDDYHVRSR